MTNNEWRNALSTFLDEWKQRDEVIGAIVTGSQVVGTATPHSDIDVHILLSDDCIWKERGNQVVGDYLIEYFANPIRLLHELNASDYDDSQHTNARMLVTGEILFDKTGEVAVLQSNAVNWMKTAFKKPTAEFVEERKYWLWDSLDGLKDLEESVDSSQSLVYYSHLQLVLSIYCTFLRAEIPHLAKARRLLTDPEFRQRYQFPEFPDEAFVLKFINALDVQKAEQYYAADQLTQYVLEQMGGFDIDNWKLRTKARDG